MRAPFQILAIPYKQDNEILYGLFHRADMGQWQFIAGGGEGDETPKEAAMREIYEEASVKTTEYHFAFECDAEIQISKEHSECIWVSYEEAMKKLTWDSNRTALYELNCRLFEKG